MTMALSDAALLQIILAPHTTEKTASISEDNQYVFKVAASATKFQVREAIERLFKVRVQGVGIVNVKPKRKVRGRIAGQRSGWKKAYVSLQPGETLDLMSHQ